MLQLFLAGLVSLVHQIFCIKDLIENIMVGGVKQTELDDGRGGGVDAQCAKPCSLP